MGTAAATPLQEIDVFELTDTAKIERVLPEAGARLFALPRASDDQLLGISSGSGWLHYIDRRQIRSGRRKPALPKNAIAARAAGLIFFEQAATLFAEPWYSQMGVPALFPDAADLEYLAALPVPDPETGMLDHWLVRYRVALRSSIRPAPGKLGEGNAAVQPPPEKIPVIGAGIDLRVGDGGAVIGLNSRWRPPAGRRRSLIYPLIPDPPGVSTPPAQLVYLLHDEHAAQRFVAPYYLSFSSEDEGSFLPASVYSLVLFILEQPEPNGTRLQALALGGSGQYSYRWASWNPAAEWDQSFRDLGSGASQTIGLGVYDVALSVEDGVTGAIARTESMVYSSGATPGAPT